MSPVPGEARKKSRRSTQLSVEIDSDEEARLREPRLSGALRGLNPKNMLETTQSSIESNKQAESDEPTPSRHATRASRNGRVPVNYSAKWHPMDDVLRPKRAARITGSRSLSSSAPRDRHHGDEHETSDESTPDLLSGDESDVSGSDCDDDDLATRVPDPKATRRSNRTEAQKPVNYSRAHHPQDHALPGYQHLAKRRKRRVATLPKPAKKVIFDEEAVSSNNEATESGSEDEMASTGAEEPVPRSPPRKRLKTLGRGSVAGVQVKPSLPREESSNTQVEAILRGDHLTRLKENEAKSNVRSDDDLMPESIKDIGAYMIEVLENAESFAGNHPQSEPEELAGKGGCEGLADGASRLPLGAINTNTLHSSGAMMPTPLSASTISQTNASQQTGTIAAAKTPPLEQNPAFKPNDTGLKDTEIEDPAYEEQQVGVTSDDHATGEVMRACLVEAARHANARDSARRSSDSPPKDPVDDSTTQTTQNPVNCSSRKGSHDNPSDDQYSSSFFDEAVPAYH